MTGTLYCLDLMYNGVGCKKCLDRYATSFNIKIVILNLLTKVIQRLSVLVKNCFSNFFFCCITYAQTSPQQSISTAQLRTVRGCLFCRKSLHRCCVRNHRFRQHRIAVSTYCDVAQIFDLVRNIYVKTSNEPSAHIRHAGELMRLTAPSGTPFGFSLSNPNHFSYPFRPKKVRNTKGPLLYNIY